MDTTRELKTLRNATSASIRELRKGIQRCGKGISWGTRHSKDVRPDVKQLGSMQSSKAFAKMEARHIHLAIGFIKGMEYKRMENFCHVDPYASEIAGHIISNMTVLDTKRNARDTDLASFIGQYDEIEAKVEAWLSTS